MSGISLACNARFGPSAHLGALGVLLMFAGSGYLIDFFARFLAPKVAAVLFPWALLPGFLAELALCAWLLVKGVNVPKWEEKARAA